MAFPALAHHSFETDGAQRRTNLASSRKPPTSWRGVLRYRARVGRQDFSVPLMPRPHAQRCQCAQNALTLANYPDLGSRWRVAGGSDITLR